MELVFDDINSKIFEKEEDGIVKKYTMINVGCYVCYIKREWYEKYPDFWKLMYYDEYKNDKRISHVSALCDISGEYFRISTEKNNSLRVIQLSNNYILNDSNSSDDNLSSFNMMTLDDYLENTVNPTNYLIRDFVNANEEILSVINYKTR